MTIDQAQLDQLKQTLQADDYRLDVDVQGESADVQIVAGPDACEECLVPKPLMQSMLAPVLGVEPASIRLNPPSDVGPSPIAAAASANATAIVNLARIRATSHSARRLIQCAVRSHTIATSVSGRNATAT